VDGAPMEKDCGGCTRESFSRIRDSGCLMVASGLEKWAKHKKIMVATYNEGLCSVDGGQRGTRSRWVGPELLGHRLDGAVRSVSETGGSQAKDIIFNKTSKSQLEKAVNLEDLLVCVHQSHRKGRPRKRKVKNRTCSNRPRIPLIKWKKWTLKGTGTNLLDQGSHHILTKGV